MSGKSVLIERRDHISWLRFNRADAMNSLSNEMVAELSKALDFLEADESVRVIIITGSGRAFSAGQDFRDISAGSPAEVVATVRHNSNVIAKIRELSKITIAAVNGFAVAGGMSIMLACDLAIAADDAKIGDGHVNYGLIPASGGTIQLAKVVGPSIAKYMAFSGRLVAASELATAGLINLVVPQDELHQRASELAEELATKSPRGITAMKRLIRNGLEQPMAAASNLAQESFAHYVYSCWDDVQAGLSAFQGKRKPTFG